MRRREAYDGAGGGAGVDTDKAHKWGIDRLWFESTDPRVTKQNMADVRSRGIGVGIKMNGDGAALAAAMDAKLTELGFSAATAPASCGAQFDSETHDWAKIEAMYDEWRRRRKTRYTVITFEPWQGGDIPPTLIQKINSDPNVLVVVQGYMTLPYNSAGDKDELYPAYLPAVIDQLVNAGLLRERVTGYIPVKQYAIGNAKVVELPYGWEGILWLFSSLAASPVSPL